MKKKQPFILYFLIGLTVIILFAPLLQQNLKLFRFQGLFGYNIPTQKPVLSYDTYHSGAYQTQAEKYLQENFGFREPMIRFYNQCAFDWFKTTSNQEISIGNDGWLYHTESALHYFGNMERWFHMTNRQVRENLAEKACILSKVNAILQEYDVHLLTFTLPTKSFIYPEHLRQQPFGDTAFNAAPYFAQLLDSLGVPHINMVPWFKQVQDTTPFNLYYSKGSHWAAGAPLAVDTMLRYMEQLGHQSLTHIHVERPYSKTYIPPKDIDLEYLLNLASPLNHEPIYEYHVSLLTDEHTEYPAVWFVGTSFYWYMTSRVNFDAVFRERDLMFYYSMFHTDRERKSFPADRLDYLRELLVHDYVVFFRDGPQLYNDGMLFPGKALISLCIDDDRLKEKTDAVTDSLCLAWNAKNAYDSTVFRNQAEILLQQHPEMFEELRGEGIPTCRNPRIAQILTERKIRTDRNWSFLLHAMAKNDSLEVRDLLKEESKKAISSQPLLRYNTYFTSYDYLDLLVDETILDIYRNREVNETDTELFQLALDSIEARILRHAYDDDTLMAMACTMDSIVRELRWERSLSLIRKQAEDWHISFDKSFKMTALWCYQTQIKKRRTPSEETLLKALEAYRIEHHLRQDEESMEDIMQKYRDLDLPLRIVINQSIEWIQQNQVP